MPTAAEHGAPEKPVDVPDGFVEFEATSAFLARIGPIWVDRRTSTPMFGLRVADHHLNNKGTAHGGLLSTFADIVCGYTLRWSRTPGPNLVTVHLATEYLHPARLGDWLDGTADVRSLTRLTACSHAIVRCATRPVVQATALFQVGSDPDRGER